MTDCPTLTLSPFTSQSWLATVFMIVMSIGLLLFFFWTRVEKRRWDRESEVRRAVSHQLWAERDPEGYAAVMQRRAEEEALVAATLAQYQPWWRHLRRRPQP